MDNTLTLTSDELAQGEALTRRPVQFIRSVFTLQDLPPFSMPEIAFAGRSNVGKSSLINALMGRPLARASNTPGRTQCLNFFDVDQAFYLVDMPGYGYAEAPKDLIKKWNRLMRDYLLGRPTLKRVFLLIDSRHGLKGNDKETMKVFDECAVSYQIVLTKADKIKPHQQIALRDSITEIIKKHPAAYPLVHSTSSEKHLGLAELRAEIIRLLNTA